jgi:hypothetical protein
MEMGAADITVKFNAAVWRRNRESDDPFHDGSRHLAI